MTTSYLADTKQEFAALIISYENIADVYFSKNHYSQAFDTYQELHQQLKSYYLINAGKSN